MRKNKMLIYVVAGLVAAYFMVPKFKDFVNGLMKKKTIDTEDSDDKVEQLEEIDLTELNNDIA